MTNAELEWRKSRTEIGYSIWFRITYENGPNLNGKHQIPCDLCCSHCHETVKIRFRLLGPAVWMQPDCGTFAFVMQYFKKKYYRKWNNKVRVCMLITRPYVRLWSSFRPGNQNILISAELFHFLAIPTLFLLKKNLVVSILCFTSFNLLCFTHEEVVSQGADDQTWEPGSLGSVTCINTKQL